MVEQEDALQLGDVIRALRVVALHLELQDAAAGDLDLGEREPQALHILGEIVLFLKCREKQKEALERYSGRASRSPSTIPTGTAGSDCGTPHSVLPWKAGM